MLTFITALCLFASLPSLQEAAFPSFTVGSCIQGPAIPTFDANKYAGRWFETQRLNVFFEDNFKCVTAQYTLLSNNSVQINNTAFDTVKQAFNVTLGNAVAPNPSAPNKLIARFPDNPRGAHYDVWQTDYLNYSLVYSCQQIVPELLKLEFAWILSRGVKSLDPKTVDYLKQFSVKLGLERTQDFVDSNYDGCSF